MSRVLILEPDVLTGFALQSEFMLADCSDEVRVLSEPKQAWEEVQTWRPNCVIANHDAADGAWLCRKIKENEAFHEIPVILMGPRSEIIPSHLLRQKVVRASGCEAYFPTPARGKSVRDLVVLLRAIGSVQATLLIDDEEAA